MSQPDKSRIKIRTIARYNPDLPEPQLAPDTFKHCRGYEWNLALTAIALSAVLWIGVIIYLICIHSK